jgi:hypothetical protein
MLAHILNAGLRALTASLILGGILIYGAGGFDSPYVRPLGGVTSGSCSSSCSASECRNRIATE